MKAVFNGHILADSTHTIVIELNHHFPPDTVNFEYLKENGNTSECPWKGVAEYFDVDVKGHVIKDGAWHYPNPKKGSAQRVGDDFTGYVGFAEAVDIVP
ncbi:MAG: DUF427 domain-containing protein [Patescibacteria group bacterium UBA2103]